ncbi:MAG: hypothetical protein KA275_01460 [Chitinophagaceae bacterium]|nr:hypothetical protein [Chitinophagaceae bacterium]
MIKNSFLFSFFFVFSCASIKKELPSISNRFVQCNNAVFYHQSGNNRIVGDVYEFVVMPLVDNIEIDSVWFGYTPVPVEIYSNVTKVITNEIIDKNKSYTIKANKDLYKNFYKNIDSSAAFKNFIPPFKFDAKAIIFYKKDNKRYHFKINEIENKGEKPYR